MGATVAAWRSQVREVLRDAGGVDVSDTNLDAVGIGPALAQYATDRPRALAVDRTPPTDSREAPIPTAGQGWSEGLSVVTRVDAPAGEIPATRIDGWQIVASSADPAVEVVLLPGTLGAGEAARIYFTGAYPTPTADPNVDVTPPAAFYPLCALAAAYVLEALAAEAARQQQGSFATDFVEDIDRSRNLYDVAQRLRIQYNTHVGIAGAGNDGASSRRLSSLKIRNSR